MAGKTTKKKNIGKRFSVDIAVGDISEPAPFTKQYPGLSGSD